MKNKLLTLALAGAVMLGALAAGTPVMADNDPIQSGGGQTSGSSSGSTTGDTKVTLTVAAKNQYTLTIPAATTLDKDEAVALKNGITVTGSNMANSVTVTASTTSDWKLTAENVDTKIGYGLYESEDVTTTTTSWNFTASEINESGEGGATKAVYAKVNADDVKNAKAGSYSDTITFTAAIQQDGGSTGGSVSASEYGEEGAQIEIQLQADGHTFVIYGTRTDGEFVISRASYDGSELATSLAAASDGNLYVEVTTAEPGDFFDIMEKINSSGSSPMMTIQLSSNGKGRMRASGYSKIACSKIIVNNRDITSCFSIDAGL